MLTSSHGQLAELLQYLFLVLNNCTHLQYLLVMSLAILDYIVIIISLHISPVAISLLPKKCTPNVSGYTTLLLNNRQQKLPVGPCCMAFILLELLVVNTGLAG